ncbi:hypothetical protein BHM03_00008484 [Ensete ventricosum]|uniref:Zinc-hook domain-containing protein n=1 Tax=Ensete ventricosum TaxID=4639 RepID=A0A427BBL3_ENSVE|nr:hypothetical protein B296_00001171 [Ensete ventricosum]RZR82109.1 hypothetical protein BHM03_00008484 [Ensete ventricosum]
MLAFVIHLNSPCSKYNIADGMRQMFDPFERVARAHHICPCCERPFSPEEEDEFVKKLVGVLAHVKAEKDAVEVLLQPVETIDRLWQEMENLKPQIEDLEYKLDSRGQGVRSMEEIQLQLNSLQSKRYSSLASVPVGMEG